MGHFSTHMVGQFSTRIDKEDGFRLFLSVEDDGDEEFFTLLTKKANLQEIMPEPD